MNPSPSLFSRSLLAGVVLVVGLTACRSTSAPKESDRTAELPDPWKGGAAFTGDFEVGLDHGDKHGGTDAAYIASIGNARAYGMISQGIRADDYRGKRVRWSGWVRTANVDSVAGLWLTIDGYTQTLARDAMSDAADHASGRALTGTSDWKHVSIVLDVPENAALIYGGAVLSGRGELLVDDLTFETVGTDVAVTKPVAPFARGDSTNTARIAAVLPSAFSNLDFEGAPAVSASTTRVRNR
jgi:hypothetical protein